MEVVELIEEMRELCEKLRCNGKRIRLVPTMGALHIGHASLIESARKEQRFASSTNNQVEEAKNKKNNNAHLRCQVNGGAAVSLGRTNNSAEFKEALADADGSLSYRFTDKHSSLTSSSNCKHPAQEEDLSLAQSNTNLQKDDIVVIVSIFVNPKQFNNSADFINYPKTMKTDLELCRKFNVDYVFAPKSSEMYPTYIPLDGSSMNMNNTPAQASSIQVYPPKRFAHDLEGRSRPGHFEGMLTVVCKLFNIIQPHDAYFGEKDYQQLVLVEQMVKELNMCTNIRPVETVRDYDLLPLSSRNVRLTREQRQIAPTMFKILIDAKGALETEHLFDYENNFRDINSLILSSMIATICLNVDDEKCKLMNVDYLELRCAKDVSTIGYNQHLNAFDCQEGCVRRQLATKWGKRVLKARLLTSVIVGEIRLLDNVEVKLNLWD